MAAFVGSNVASGVAVGIGTRHTGSKKRLAPDAGSGVDCVVVRPDREAFPQMTVFSNALSV